ncbi:hypothetical protein KBC25_03690 [Candidatus Pacearchaeota archaeon]|nr:hypothetical protein [Candidatus Pacearchaeota archaeon]
MNFRPTKLKVILSMVLSALLWVIVFVTFKDLMNQIPKVLFRYFNMYNLSEFFSANNFVLFFIQFILFYIIFSLLHQKKVKSN